MRNIKIIRPTTIHHSKSVQSSFSAPLKTQILGECLFAIQHEMHYSFTVADQWSMHEVNSKDWVTISRENRNQHELFHLLYSVQWNPRSTKISYLETVIFLSSEPVSDATTAPFNNLQGTCGGLTHLVQREQACQTRIKPFSSYPIQSLDFVKH